MTERGNTLRRVALFALWAAGLAGALVLHQGGGSGDAPGSFDARPATVLAPRTARVAQVLKKAGDVVVQGTPVLELDGAEAELEIAVARVDLERLSNEVLAQAVEVRGSDFEAGARLEIEAERAAVDLSTLVAAEKRDRAELATLEAQLTKQTQLVEQKLVSSEQRDELALRRSAVAERVAESAGALAAARARDDAARKRLREWRTSHNVSEDQRTGPERAAVRAQEERIKQLEQQRAALTVRAPVAGVLSEVLAAEGSTARAGDAVFVVMPASADRATAWVDEAAAAAVQVGDRCELRPLDGRGPMRAGVVRALGAGVIEIPQRFWSVPGEPSFGRAVFIEVVSPAPADAASPDAPALAPLPGQRLDARCARP